MNKTNKAAICSGVLLVLGLALLLPPMPGYAGQETMNKKTSMSPVAEETVFKIGAGTDEEEELPQLSEQPSLEAPAEETEEAESLENPENPENPGKPEDTDNPGNPENPENPGNMENQENPENPGNTENPENPDVELPGAIENEAELGEENSLAEDVNRDGQLSVADLAMLAAWLGAGEEHPDWPQLQGADLDGNGIIDDQDLMLLSRAILSATD